MEALAEVSDIPFTTVPVTVQQALRERIPLPFPLTAEEDELYDPERRGRGNRGLLYEDASGYCSG